MLFIYFKAAEMPLTQLEGQVASDHRGEEGSCTSPGRYVRREEEVRQLERPNFGKMMENDEIYIDFILNKSC